MKYKNKKRCTQDGVFDSGLELKRWKVLQSMERAGCITDLKRQTAFMLIPVQRDRNGKVIERACSYKADFTYTNAAGELVVEDTKSPATITPEFIIKRKLMLYKYNIRVKIITKENYASEPAAG